MNSHVGLVGASHIRASASKVSTGRKVHKRITAVPGVNQTNLDQFLDGGQQFEVDDAEWQRTVGRVLRHDLLNKLTVAQGGLELFERSREEKFLDMARKNLEACGEIEAKMSLLENSILPAKLTPMEVACLSERVMRSHQGHGVDLEVQGNGWVMADDALLHVLDNLVSNAIRHAAPSNVRIDIEEMERNVLVKVTDDGVGIPMEARDGLFQEGFKYGPKGNTGLGLFMVRRIVQRYGGNIRMEQNQPNGTVFCIELRNIAK